MKMRRIVAPLLAAVIVISLLAGCGKSSGTSENNQVGGDTKELSINKIVSVHTAKCPETDHMIHSRHFSLLQDNSIFINTSRGSVVDEESLIQHLKQKRFKAVLDVYQKEPLSENSELLKLDNVILFPHQAGPTKDRLSIITKNLIMDLKSYIETGNIENVITKEMAMRMTIA